VLHSPRQTGSRSQGSAGGLAADIFTPPGEANVAGRVPERAAWNVPRVAEYAKLYEEWIANRQQLESVLR